MLKKIRPSVIYDIKGLLFDGDNKNNQNYEDYRENKDLKSQVIAKKLGPRQPGNRGMPGPGCTHSHAQRRKRLSSK
jgi:hypothetical protein